MTETVPLTAEQAAALDAARQLAAAGVPVFLAPPDPASSTGYQLPRNWQRTTADPAVVDQWRPGMAIAAVMGHGLDVVDIDPRNGGDPAALNGRTPTSYGAALTPSGGVHSFVKSLGVRKRSNVLPGIDVQAGAPDGSGRGFVFLAPTVRASKVTGELLPYRWAIPLDLQRWRTEGPADVSGLALAELVRGGPGDDTAPSPDDFMRTGPWANIEATLAQGRNNGVAKLAAALRGRGGWRLEDATRYMYAEVWPLIDQAQGGHPFTAEEFEATIAAAWRQYPDGAEQRAADAATPPTVDEATGVFVAPAAGRYFGEKNTFLSATLAGDVAALGPLARGIDGLPWAYRGGVWRPDPDVILNRCAFLLGERYRPGHTTNAEHHLRGRLPEIASEPVEKFVNVRNGLLDWRTGQLHPHTPNVPSTVQLGVAWDAAATCPAFEEFVAQVVAPDVVGTIWELIGYLMYSGNPLHKAVMLTGTGRNGKGTFLRVMVALLGQANVTAVSLHDLVNTRFTTASLFGKLANIAGDIDGGYLENTAVLKGITGGDVISAEHKGRPRFDFSPWAVPVFSANRIPSSADTTIGYLSRWLVVNFPNDFTGRENRQLDRLLRTPAELAGIAVKGLTALPGLLERGDFAETDSARAAREEFARRVDQVRTWLYDCTELDPKMPWQPRTELYQAYQRWAARDGHRPVKAAEFYDRLEAAGAEPAIVRGVRGFKGVDVIDAGHINTGQGAAGAGFGTWESRGSEAASEGAATTAQGAGTNPAPAPAAEIAAEPAPSRNPANTGAPTTQGADGAGNPQPPRVRAYVRGVSGMGPSCTPAPSQTSQSGADGIRDQLLEAQTQLAADAAAEQAAAARVAQLRAERSATNKAEHAARQARGEYQTREAHDAEIEQRRQARAAERAAAALLAPIPGLDPKTAARVEAAAGPLLQLPAIVTRDGGIAHLPTGQAYETFAALGMLTELTVDVEHTGYPIGHADYALRTVQLGGEHAAVVFDATDPEQTLIARTLLAGADVLHAHSATADLIPLAVAGIIDDLEDAWERMHDTVIPAKLADPASTGSDPSLKQLAATVLGDTACSPAADAARGELFKAGKWLTEVEPTTAADRSGWAQADPRCTTMVRYAAADVLDDAAIAARLPQPPPAILERERLAQRMTARITHTGVPLRRQHLAAKRAEHQAALAEAGDRLRALGVDNPGSDQQVAARAADFGAALPRTKTGRLSVAKDALIGYRGADGQLGELVRARLDYQHHETALGLFLDPYHLIAEHGDGRVRPTVYTLNAATGRASCVRPNLQQLSRQGGVRGCIGADPGELIISADFSGVELRTMAALSQDTQLMSMLTAGVDVHMETAKQAYGPGATKEDRYRTKRGVFGKAYGSGIPGIARTLGITESEAAAISASFDATAPGLKEFTERLKQAVQGGMRMFETYSGRIVHLDVRQPHKALNYVTQGTARELLIDALVRWRDTRWGDRVLMPVHDELLVWVPAEDAEEATAELVRCMQTTLFGMPIVAEASEPSAYWRDAS